MGVFPIFVDNVSSSVQTKDLRKIFSECGRIEEVVILEDNKAFVNFACPDDAIKALRNFRNYPFFGKKLFVTASQELDEFINLRKRDQYMNDKRRHTIDQIQSNRRHSSDQQRDQYHHRQQEGHRDQRRFSDQPYHQDHHRDQRHSSDQRDHQDNHRDQRHSSEQRDQRLSSEQRDQRHSSEQRDHQHQQHHGYYHGCDVRDRRRHSNSKHLDSDESRSNRSKSFDEHERAPAKRKITLTPHSEEEGKNLVSCLVASCMTQISV